MQELARRGLKFVDIMRANVPELSCNGTQLNYALVPYFMVEWLSRPYRSVNWAIKAIGL